MLSKKIEAAFKQPVQRGDVFGLFIAFDVCLFSVD
jgi:hypothetical protein